MAVDDVARLLEAVGQFENGAGEEDEPLGVVGIILGATIERRPVEVGIVADEINGDVRGAVPARQVRLEDLRLLLPRPDRYVKLPPRRLDREPARRERLPVGGNHHGDMAAEPRERPGERADNVGQAPGFGKRRRFARHLEDTHGPPTSS